MNLCICRMYLSILSFIYKVPQYFLCVYVLICIQFGKFYVAWPSWMLGMLQYGIRAPVFNTEPEWFEQVELKRNF
jgi:hypothetical protein